MARTRFFLAADPFPLGSDDACFVPMPALRRRLERILQSLREDQPPLCIVAPRGSGKTTLLRQVRMDLDPQWQVATVSGTAGLERDAFLDAFGRAFSLPPGDDGRLEDLLERLEAHLDAHLPRDRRALVVVDDADCDDAATRAHLDAVLAQRQSPRLRFLIARQAAPELRAGEETPLVRIDIPPLTRAQCDDYVHTRLSAAGLRGDSPFSDDMLSSIHNSSGGRPGRIHRVAAQILANWQDPSLRGGPGGGRRRDAFRSRLAAVLRPKERFRRA